MEIYPAKSKFWEPNIGETFNAFLDFVKSERGINDPYDLNIIQNNTIYQWKKPFIMITGSDKKIKG